MLLQPSTHSRLSNKVAHVQSIPVLWMVNAGQRETDREFPHSFHARLHVWFMVLQDKSRPLVAGSEADGCMKHESSCPSMFHTWPGHEADIGQSLTQIQ